MTDTFLIIQSPVPLSSFPKHIMYTAFTAESWGFAGSQRFVHDISTPFECQYNASKATKGCPYTNGGCTVPCVRDLDFTRINFDKIDSIFEISQVATPKQTYYAHVDNSGDPVASKIIERLSAVSAAANGSSFIQAAFADGSNRRLPPSSSMAFLEKNRKIPAVVLGDYKDNLNRYDQYNRNIFCLVCTENL
jgi:nicastrin